MIFRKLGKNYILVHFNRYIQHCERQFCTNNDGDRSRSLKTLSVKKKRRFKPCSSSTPTPCKSTYVARLRLPYYKDFKTLKSEPSFVKETSHNFGLVKKNLTPSTNKDVQLDEQLRKTFDDIKKQKAKLCAELEKRLQKKAPKPIEENDEKADVNEIQKIEKKIKN